MAELLKKISEITDVYDDFILGVINYAKKKPEHIDLLLDFINSSDNLTTSDIIYFMMKQPDFLDDKMSSCQKVC